MLLLICHRNFLLATPITTLINSETFFPSQCTSSFTSGQTITYPSCTGGPCCLPTKQTVTALQTVFAWHMNGFNVPQATSSQTSPTSGTASNATSGTSRAGSPSSTAGSSGSGLSIGASAGVGVGVALIVIAMSIGGLFAWRRRKRRRTGILERSGEDRPDHQGQNDQAGSGTSYQEMETPEVVRVLGRHEMEDKRSMKRGGHPVLAETDVSTVAELPSNTARQKLGAR